MQNKQYLERLEVDMKLRGLSTHTQDSYRIHVTKFLERAKRPVEELDETDVREFLIHLIRENKIQTVTVNSYSASIRFFFVVTLNRTMNYLQIPRFKTAKKLPEILTREEIHTLIGEYPNVKHKAFFQIAYGSDLRISEIAALRIKDIDSKSMRVFVNGGKGKKDRYRVAISNNRILSMDEGKISFRWRDYKDGNRMKIMSLDAHEFIRRFLTHVLPAGFRKSVTLASSRRGINQNAFPYASA